MGDRFQSTAARACAILTSLVVCAAAVQAQMFQKAYGTPREERAEWTVQTSDGGYITVGWRGPDSAAPSIYAVKTDSNGVLQWDRELAGPSIDVANRVLDVGDGYVIAGETGGSPIANPGIFMLKLDLAGNPMWAWAYPGTPFAGGLHNQTALEITGLADGGFILGGRMQSVQGINQAPILVRTDAGGNLIWARYYVDFRFNDATFASFADVHPYVSFNGEPGFLACGYTTGNTRDSLLVATDLDGVVRWARIYPQVNFSDFALGVDVAANGQILVNGYTKSVGEGGGTYVFRADQLGTLLWYNTFRSFQSTNSMLETPTTRIVLGGNATDFVSFNDPAIMLLGPGGNHLWTMTYGGANQEYGECVVPTTDGGYHLSAWTDSFGQGLFDLYAIKTDALGMSGCNEQPAPENVNPDLPQIDIPMRGFNIDMAIPLQYTPIDPPTIEENLCESPCIDPPSGLVAWWPLDELAAADNAEELIAGNFGVPFNGPAPLAGEYVDNSRCFNGANQYIEVADDPALNFGTGDFTIDAWIRTTSLSSVRIIVDKRTSDASGTTGYSFFTSAGNIAFQLADGGGSSVCAACPTAASCTNYISSDFVADGNWHLVAVTIDRGAGVGTFYVDGVPTTTFDITCHPGSVTNSGALRIGSRSFSVSSVFDGCIDEVELFNRVLQVPEMVDLYVAGTAGKCKVRCVEPPPGMVAWLTMDEDDPAATLDDLIFNNDGTPVNGPLPLLGEYVVNSWCFDGLDDYIEVANDTTLNYNTFPIGVDAWIRTTNLGTQRIIDKRVQIASGTTGYSVYTQAGRLWFQIADGAGSNVCGSCPTAASCTDYDSGVFVADGAWRHIAVTVDRPPGIGTFYVDGAAVGTFDASCHAGSISNSSPLRIGASTLAVTDVFDGCIDEVEIFRTPPTAVNIAAIYAAGSAGKCRPACGCPGDVNGDCMINLADLSIILANFGTGSGATFADGDMDGDGDVDLADLGIMLAVFGTSC